MVISQNIDDYEPTNIPPTIKLRDLCVNNETGKEV